MKAILSTFLFVGITLSFHSALKANEGHLRFIENKGQVSDQFHHPRPDIQYVVASQKFTCHLKQQGYSYQLFEESGRPGTSVRPIDLPKRRTGQNSFFTFYRLDMSWIGSNPNVQIIQGNQLEGYDNYYLPVCPQGATHVKSFSSVNYRNLFEGIDMKWYEMNGQLKYDYFVNAGADYKKIQWTIEGANKLELSSSGQLIIETPLGKLVEETPLVLQDGKKLETKWRVIGNIISFEIKNVNQNKPMIIDPLVRAWGTYFGGSAYDELGFSHIDKFNDIYFTGGTTSPTSLNIATVGSHQSTYGGGKLANQYSGDAVLLKMNSSGVRLWSTYYGGSDGDNGGSCSSDSQGNIYMVGTTSSSNTGVIATPGSFQSSIMTAPTIMWTSDVYLVKFTSAGVRIWATYYGDSLWDWANGVSVDRNDNIFIAGGTEFVNSSSSVFATAGAHQTLNAGGNFDGFIAKFSSSGARIWSTYLGGEGDDQVYYCASDTVGNLYVTGITTSTMVLSMASANAHQTVYSGGMGDANKKKRG